MPRIFQNKISKMNFPRFQPIKRDLSPSPSSYQFEKSKDTTKQKPIKYSFKKQKRITYFEDKATRNKVPGAGTYDKVQAAYSLICKSPRVSVKRH
mmetsp:Transcript_13215/g.22419  ORF Transcript_13215/g.22419 Transcript_13215/m.22419 type:complete len:95 (+) Transcript_13215:1173-1457(+)